jgi:hypothetical protein
MDHGLTRLVTQSKAFIPILREEYDALRNAKTGILRALGIEEKFNILVENYREFERYLLSATFDEITVGPKDWSDRMAVLHETNRHLANLLSAARLYLDQTKHDISALLGAAALEAFNGATHVEYDSLLGYRVMEELRNYVQHRGLPIQSVSFSGQRRDILTKEFFVHSFQPKISVELLAADPDVKPRIIEELSRLGERISIKDFAREYLTGLSRAHTVARALLNGPVQEWRGRFLDAQDRFRKESGEGDSLGLAVIARDMDGRPVTVDQIFLEPVDRREWLARRNPVPLRTDLHIVSGE